MNEHESEDIRLTAVYRAPNEDIAQIIRALLEGDGIKVALKSAQIPWYDGVMTAGEGYWGDVFVEEHHAERARQIIEAYKPDSK